MSTTQIGPAAAAARIPSAADTRQKDYQHLKARVHQDLLNRLNLERLTGDSPRHHGHHRWAQGHNSDEPARARDAGDRRHQRALRPRPPRSLAAGSFDLGHPGQPCRPGLHRAGRQDRRDRHHFQRRPAPAADHRADRQLGRPAHRRIESDGRRAAPGRVARERDHPAAGP